MAEHLHMRNVLRVRIPKTMFEKGILKIALVLSMGRQVTMTAAIDATT